MLFKVRDPLLKPAAIDRILAATEGRKKGKGKGKRSVVCTDRNAVENRLIEAYVDYGLAAKDDYVVSFVDAQETLIDVNVKARAISIALQKYQEAGEPGNGYMAALCGRLPGSPNLDHLMRQMRFGADLITRLTEKALKKEPDKIFDEPNQGTKAIDYLIQELGCIAIETFSGIRGKRSRSHNEKKAGDSSKRHAPTVSTAGGPIINFAVAALRELNVKNRKGKEFKSDGVAHYIERSERIAAYFAATKAG